MDDFLSDVVDVLSPTSEQMQAYESVFDRVEEVLDESPYEIDRTIAGGSFAKGTGIADKMDLDITFFLDNHDPPFDDCLPDIKNLVKRRLNNKGVKNKKNSIQIYYSCDYLDESLKVDLLPAPNYVADTTDDDDVCEEQHRRTLEKIKSAYDPFKARKMYVSSFTEASVQFIKGQSYEVRQLVRLAKFWKDSIYYDGFVPGVSSTIEIVAVHAGILTKKSYGQFSLCNAFRIFLTVMEDIGNANITFSHQEMDGACRHTFYDKDEIDVKVKYAQPLILDPVDPYNNRLHGDEIRKMFVEVLSKKANESLDVFNNAVSMADNYEGEDDQSTYELFNALCPGPFDSCFPDGMPSCVIETPEEMAMTTNRFPNIEVRKTNFLTERRVKFLLHLCERIVNMAKKLDLDCETVLSSFFKNAIKLEFEPLNREPNYYHHKLRIPISNDELVNIFLRWESSDSDESSDDCIFIV